MNSAQDSTQVLKPAASRRKGKGKFVWLSSLRALGVVLVLIYHFYPALLPGGFIGVDIFFVFSGFLITSLLVREYGTKGHIWLTGFYQRRLRRLLPAIIATLLVVLPLSLLISPDFRVGIAQQVASVLGWVTNYYEIINGQSYANQLLPHLFVHTWTLSIEMQFYIFWGAVLFLVIPRFSVTLPGGRCSTKRARYILLVLAIVLAIASFVMMQIFLIGADDPSMAYFNTVSHIFPLMIGSAVGLVAGFPRTKVVAAFEKMPPKAGLAIVITSLLAIVAIAWLLPFESILVYRFGLLLTSLLVGLVILVGRGFQGRLSRVRESRILNYLADRSYSLYLFHWPLLIIANNLGKPGSPLFFENYQVFTDYVFPVIALVLTFVCAHLSYRFVEQPFTSKAQERRAAREALTTQKPQESATRRGDAAALPEERLAGVEYGEDAATETGGEGLALARPLTAEGPSHTMGARDTRDVTKVIGVESKETAAHAARAGATRVAKHAAREDTLRPVAQADTTRLAAWEDATRSAVRVNTARPAKQVVSEQAVAERAVLDELTVSGGAAAPEQVVPARALPAQAVLQRAERRRAKIAQIAPERAAQGRTMPARRQGAEKTATLRAAHVTREASTSHGSYASNTERGASETRAAHTAHGVSTSRASHTAHTAHSAPAPSFLSRIRSLFPRKTQRNNSQDNPRSIPQNIPAIALSSAVALVLAIGSVTAVSSAPAIHGVTATNNAEALLLSEGYLTSLNEGLAGFTPDPVVGLGQTIGLPAKPSEGASDSFLASVSLENMQNRLSGGSGEGTITVLGDSVCLNAASEIAEATGAYVDADGYRAMQHAVPLIQELQGAGALGEYVVVAMATNIFDDSPARAQEIIDIMEPGHHLIFVTAHGIDLSYFGLDDYIRDLPNRYPWVSLADWHAAIAGNEDQLSPDGIHLNGAVSRDIYVQCIIDAVEAARGGPVS